MDCVRDEAARRVRTMYRTSAHLYRDLRAQVLAVDAARYRLEHHRKTLGRRLEWTPRWATGSQTSSLFRGELSSWASEPLVSAELNGVPVALSAQHGGPVQIWDPAQQSCVATLEGHTRSVTAMDCVEVDGVTYVVTASENGTIRVWDLERTTELRRFTVRDDEAARSAAERGMKTLVAGLACTRLHGDVLIVGCAPDGSAWVRDLLSGEVRRRLPGLSSWKSDLPVVCLEAQETAMVFVRSPAGVLRRWDLETGEWAHLEDLVDCMAVAISVQDGCTLVSLGYRDGRLQFRDPTTDAVVSSCRVGQGWVTAMAFTELDGRAVMVVGYADGSMELRDQRGGRLLARLNGHAEWIHFIAVGAGYEVVVLER